jgi:dienelactone hydrolase
MGKLLLALSTVVLIGYASSHSQESGDATASELVASAKAFVALLAERDFSNAEMLLDDTMKSLAPKEELQKIWDGVIAKAGAFKKQDGTRTEEGGGHSAVIITCEFEKAALPIRVVFDQERRVAGLFCAPAEMVFEYTPPGYAEPDAFHEKDVIVGTGEWALPGTLTLPVGHGSFPAVVLVHGSGPNDRDESSGPNRPFRDLAWGLASQGIAVLRYEKRTKQHGHKYGSVLRPTVKEETVDDALAAVALLRKTEEIDTNRIFVLGHSLGGTLVPRIGKADPGIAGFIVLAGAVKPLEDALLEQATYMCSLDGVVSKEEEASLEWIKELVAKIKNLKPSDVDSPAYLYGSPASYWLDLRGYNPPEAAKELKQPMLILQGERDYQVTMDNFQGWRTALSSRRNVSCRSYPELNHLFIEGIGKSAPSEYDMPGHVAEIVIDDIAGWIKKPSGVHD